MLVAGAGRSTVDDDLADERWRPTTSTSGRNPSQEDVPMIIVSGSIHVDEDARDAYLEGCREVILAARAAEGCLDFHLAADPIEPDRINVYEQWETAAAVEAFRGSGPSDDQSAAVTRASVAQHEVASTTSLT
jgi:quinol monooxygenase YgiN